MSSDDTAEKDLIGRTIGSYVIEARLGAGGMGEVFRARDTRLGRAVAIKLLPPEVGADEERFRRFNLEARTASSLNHPHILVIHDIGEIMSIDILHHNEVAVLDRLDRVDRHDVRMVELGRCLGLADEALTGFRVFRETFRKKLQCDLTFEFGVLGKKDFAHAARAELLSYLIMCDCFVLHCILMISCGVNACKCSWFRNESKTVMNQEGE